MTGTNISFLIPLGRKEEPKMRALTKAGTVRNGPKEVTTQRDA